MTFRRIYWVLSELRDEGALVTGVFTSPMDLIDHGFSGAKSRGANGIRLALVQLDKPDGVLGRWISPSFQNIEQDLQEFVRTGEFSQDSIEHLVSALEAFRN